ncbi:hypothetical protein ACFX1X_012823 [Malus domestica]
MNEGGNKRSSLLAQEIPVEKKLKTSSVALEGPPAAERPMIDMTSSNKKTNEAARSEPMAPTMSRMVSTTADRIAQHRGPVVPQCRSLC